MDEFKIINEGNNKIKSLFGESFNKMIKNSMSHKMTEGFFSYVSYSRNHNIVYNGKVARSVQITRSVSLWILLFSKNFGGKYNYIHKFTRDNDTHIPIPKEGFYYRRLDNKTIVICTIFNIVKEGSGRKRNSDEYQYDFKFIGANCHYWASYYRNGSFKMMNHYRRTIDDSNIISITHLNSKCDETYQEPKTCKPFNKLILSKKHIDEINNIDKFIKSIDVYKKYDIPYKLGSIIYGPPGTGKSSFAYALGKKYGIPVIQLTVENIFNMMSKGNSSIELELDDIGKYINSNVKRIILIEEFDSLLKSKSLSISNKDESVSGELRRDQIIGFIDSLPENSIIVATTNDIDIFKTKEYEAIVRPGRFDIEFEMEAFNKEQTVELINAYDVDPSFIERYRDEDFPISPSKVQRDVIQEICNTIIHKGE